MTDAADHHSVVSVFPEPRRVELRDGSCTLDEGARMLIPAEPTDHDRFLARFLMAELTDRYRLAVYTERTASLPGAGSCVVMGTFANPLVRTLCDQRGIRVSAEDPGPEGYILDVSPDGILIAGCDERGALYGLQSLRQLMTAGGEAVRIPCVHIRDWPRKPFRGIRFFLPGKEQIPFFKRLVRDFALYFKYNTLVLETNAAMRLDRHPELGAGSYELARDMNYTRRDRPEGPGRQFQDSTHHDTGDFGLLEKDDVAELCRHARQYGMEIIPEIPSLTHAYYLLARHREFAEIQQAEWPDTYCPLVPEVYDLYFDVLDEYIEVMEPAIVHIGHDEWRMPMDVCERCRGLDYRRLFADDVKKIHEHLAQKDIRVAMWGDHLLERVREKGHRDTETSVGYKFRRPGALAPELVQAEIPKDILIFNWFWNAGSSIGGEENEAQLAEWGFEQVFGNFTPGAGEQDWERRSARESLLGAAVSSWVRTDEFNFGKDQMRSFIGCAGLLWSDRWLARDDLAPAIQAMMPTVRLHLRGTPLPGEDGEPVTPLDIRPAFNATVEDVPLDEAMGAVRSGPASAGWKEFMLSAAASETDPFALAVATRGTEDTSLPLQSGAIPINEDPSSILFLHACARPAGNIAGHFMICNFPDCADQLGWYEVVYADGFVATVPIRYAVNILEWHWARESGGGNLCWQADPVDCGADASAPVTFFAWEWLNPRFGKVIREIRLRGTEGFVNAHGEPIPSNAVVLRALSLVKKRPAPPSEYAGEDF